MFCVLFRGAQAFPGGLRLRVFICATDRSQVSDDSQESRDPVVQEGLRRWRDSFRRLREDRDLKQTELAAEITRRFGHAFDQSQVSHLESGQSQARSGLIIELCKILNVTPNELFNYPTAAAVPFEVQAVIDDHDLRDQLQRWIRPGSARRDTGYLARVLELLMDHRDNSGSGVEPSRSLPPDRGLSLGAARSFEPRRALRKSSAKAGEATTTKKKSAGKKKKAAAKKKSKPKRRK